MVLTINVFDSLMATTAVEKGVAVIPTRTTECKTALGGACRGVEQEAEHERNEQQSLRVDVMRHLGG